MSYWRLTYYKKNDRGKWEIICTSDGQKDRWVRILEEDPTTEKLEVKPIE